MQRRWIVRLTIGAVFAVGFFAMLWTLTVRPIPDGNRDVMITLLGGLAGSVTTIIAFYFGDSEGSDSGGGRLNE